MSVRGLADWQLQLHCTDLPTSCLTMLGLQVLTPLHYTLHFSATNVSLESSSSGGHQAVPVLGTVATASTTLGQHRPGLDIQSHYTTATNTTNTASNYNYNYNKMRLVVGLVWVVKLFYDLTVPGCPQWERMCWSGLQGPPGLGLV